MENWGFSDGNIAELLDARRVSSLPDIDRRLQLHSSLVQRLSLERELEGHQGCVNSLAWNSSGSLLISGSDDTQINIWNYENKRLIHSIDSGHSANIFCTKFVPETSDEVVVSGAGDAEVRVFHLSRVGGATLNGNAAEPLATFQCHSRRVKKLAVEVGNPNVVWSASEDGTLRQHDFREGSSCPPAGSSNQECRNVLLDLRCASKKSLSDHPKQSLALKSCDISSARPHQLLVGGSDAFARLYDRRMLPPLSSCQVKLKPPPCVSYFCPVHLSDRKGSSLHMTHVAFSPNGEELLLSYSGEHAYLMGVNHGYQDVVKYTSDDISKNYLFPVFVEAPTLPASKGILSGKFTRIGVCSRKIGMYDKLVQAAARTLEDDSCSRYLYGIEACSEVLDGKGPEIDDVLKHDCLCIRAALLLKRKWKNDVHMAIRDCIKAHVLNPSSFEAYYYMSEALTQLGRHKEALNYATAAERMDPSNRKVADSLQSIKDHIAAVEAEKDAKKNEGTSRAEVRPTTIRSLGNVFLLSGENSDTSQDGPRSEREDSDYDEEMEVDFETPMSSDEVPDESRVLRGSVNLRFRQREDMARGNGSSNGSCPVPSSSSQIDGNGRKPEFAIDMRQRYVGHCNVGTDIKQASFLGQKGAKGRRREQCGFSRIQNYRPPIKGEFIASGSDDGRWFIWEKRTGRLIKVLAGDEAVVNCVQCHPYDNVVATSGIDHTIKLWTPHGQMPSMVAGGTAGPETADVLSVIEGNQQKMCHNRETILPFEFFERFRMHELAEGSLQPFECAQT